METSIENKRKKVHLYIKLGQLYSGKNNAIIQTNAGKK